MESVKVFAVENLPLFQKGDNIGQLICESAEKQGTSIQENDIIVVTQSLFQSRRKRSQPR